METIDRKNRKLTDEEFRMLIECSLNDLVSLEEDEDESSYSSSDSPMTMVINVPLLFRPV